MTDSDTIVVNTKPRERKAAAEGATTLNKVSSSTANTSYDAHRMIEAQSNLRDHPPKWPR
jgi:hypothetical protein